MNDYEKEMVKFFFEEDKFRNLCKIAAYHPQVKRLLFEDFWKDVKRTMQSLASDRKMNWAIEFTGGDLFTNVAKLLIYKTEFPRHSNTYPLVAIAIERLTLPNKPYLGLWVNNDCFDYDLDRIRAQAILFNENLKLVVDGDKWWPFWKHLQVDFSQDEELVRILPDNRKDLVVSIANEALELAESCNNLMLDICTYKKN